MRRLSTGFIVAGIVMMVIAARGCGWASVDAAVLPMKLTITTGYAGAEAGLDTSMTFVTYSVGIARLFMQGQSGARNSYEMTIEVYDLAQVNALASLTSPLRASTFPTAEFVMEIAWSTAAPSYELTMTVKTQAEVMALLDLLQANIDQFPGAQ